MMNRGAGGSSLGATRRRPAFEKLAREFLDQTVTYVQKDVDRLVECFERVYRWSDADGFAEALDQVREALGQKETHYLVIADDVEELVKSVERDDGSAKAVLQKLRER